MSLEHGGPPICPYWYRYVTFGQHHALAICLRQPGDPHFEDPEYSASLPQGDEGNRVAHCPYYLYNPTQSDYERALEEPSIIRATYRPEGRSIAIVEASLAKNHWLDPDMKNMLDGLWHIHERLFISEHVRLRIDNPWG